MRAHLIRACYVNTSPLRLCRKGESGNHKHPPGDYLGRLVLFILTLRWADKINLVCMFGRQAEETLHRFTQRQEEDSKEKDTIWRKTYQLHEGENSQIEETRSGKVIILANFTENKAGDPLGPRTVEWKSWFPVYQGKMTDNKTSWLLIFMCLVQVRAECFCKYICRIL